MQTEHKEIAGHQSERFERPSMGRHTGIPEHLDFASAPGHSTVDHSLNMQGSTLEFNSYKNGLTDQFPELRHDHGHPGHGHGHDASQLLQHLVHNAGGSGAEQTSGGGDTVDLRRKPGAAEQIGSGEANLTTHLASTGTAAEIAAVEKMVTVRPGTSTQVRQEVKAAITHMPPSVLKALIAQHPHIVVEPGGEGGVFDAGRNQITIQSNGQLGREVAAHEFAHVWDLRNGITGGWGNGGQQFKAIASQEFGKLNPDSLPLGTVLEDPPNIRGVGAGDVMAEMVAGLTGNGQSGDARILIQHYPKLASFLKQKLGLG